MCFDLHSIASLFISLVVIGAIVTIVQLLLPRVLGPLGEYGSLIMAILRIILWAVVLIVIIYFVFELLSCLIGGGGPSLSLGPRR